MMHITEDTPPDMLAGAMDLTLHLPNDRSVKMSVERSTPMMDLLVQITTRNHLQLSNHTLQVLGMAPSSEHSDKILPYKPNTPIGALDTQHIRVLPKGRTLPAPKYTAPGHQPFESTFRLKVHLPRNQLYVTRVSRNVLLEDIMKKVCEEKNLDPIKYEFKHPGNLDEVLDPKLTLSDYQITEIYVVLKGTTNLSQAFSATDIMTLRKEEERKQMHNKTGGGVFNLIFKRGKSNMGSGSISSDNRSISPTHSDDSRSVTPPAPAFQAPPIVGPPKKEPPPDRPKPPQRKRRPAPKPPQHQNADAAKEAGSEKTSSVVSDDVSPNPPSKKSSENGLTICHSRNSSDSSGYHEASILSDHCANTSLPRTRPKSAFVGDQVPPQGSSTSNLSKMAAHSRSTTSLMAGRKKKAAPPPPPLVVSPANSVVAQSEKPSPLVASQSDTTTKESITSSNLTPIQTPYDSLPPCPLEISPPTTLRREEKSLDSTDSGIAQDAHSDREKDGDDEFSVQTPPPPPILDDIEQSKTNLDTSRTEISYILNRTSATNDINRQAELSQDIIPPPSLVTTVSGTDAATTKIPEKLVATPARISEVAPPLPAVERPKTPAVDSNLLTPVSLHPNNKQTDQHIKIVDIDWQYQLPSPPKAFRDSSPALLAATCETNSVSDFKDSVVTSPELFEKLRSLEESQSEKDTLKSEGTSIASEEPLNTLSLEHLERRKSLVYNRELATSLKMTDNLEKTGPTETFAGSLTTFQTTFDSLSREKEVKHFKEPARTNHSAHTIPNFKITTYDVPKQNITVFEDDTIRSNTVSSNPTKNQFDRSMENISFSKRPIMEENNQEAKDYKFYRPVSTNVGSIATVSRSGSFSKENRFPLKPVSRSKSHLTLNKYQDGSFKLTSEDALSRSNSLFDVSGLQSLEVMKLIQNKLSTPTGSMENVSFKETQQNQGPQNRSLNIDITKKEPPKPSEIKPVEKKPETQAKIYYYKGPPAVNMSTWSERPKIPVSVKEDADYKLGNTNVSSKLIVNTTNNNITSNNSIEVRNSEPKRNGNSQIFEQNNKNVGIRVNGSSEQITQESGNVVIKIGGSQNSYSKNIESQRFLGPTAYRKPFASINRNYHMNPRPHSIAFDSDFDISRVPVVRSVEFKKPYKDSHPKNTSVTHIYQGSDNINILHQNGHHTDLSSEKYKSTENLRSTEKQESEPTRRVFRVGSLKPADNAGPVVRGFKTSSNDIGHRLSWNPSINYGTLPTKSKTEREYSTNQHVPFSQSTLRRTESSKIINVDHNQNIATPPPLKAVNNFESNSYNSLPPTLTSSKLEIASVPPPPPPQMPKVALRHVPQKQMKIRSVETDPRDMLLESIRNFGGKKGLRAGKA